MKVDQDIIICYCLSPGRNWKKKQMWLHVVNSGFFLVVSGFFADQEKLMEEFRAVIRIPSAVCLNFNSKALARRT